MTLSRHASSSHSNFGAAGQRGHFIIVGLDQQPARQSSTAPTQPGPGLCLVQLHGSQRPSWSSSSFFWLTVIMLGLLLSLSLPVWKEGNRAVHYHALFKLTTLRHTIFYLCLLSSVYPGPKEVAVPRWGSTTQSLERALS